MNSLVDRLKNVLLYIVLCIIVLQAAFLRLIDSKDPSFQIISLNKDTERVFEIVPHVKWIITEDLADPESLTQHLLNLSEYGEVINLSLIPADTLSGEDYIFAVSEANRILKDNALSNVHVIVYPKNKKDLALCKREALGSIGVVVEQSDDLKWLDVVYTSQRGKGPLFIEDNIESFYSGDIPKGIKTVYEVYYTLSLKYPEIKTILMPYRKAPPLTQYASVYASILDEMKTTAILLNEDSEISGEQKIVLRSDHEFFKSTAYVYYKWNDGVAIEKPHYPYPITVDTTALHNGINRLKIMGYDQNNSVLWRKTLEIEVINAQVVERAPRVDVSYPTDKIPSYKGSSIPVLMYHSFSDKIAKESENSYVDVGLFEEQLQALLAHHYTPITFYDLHQYAEGLAGLPDKPIIITADDGYLDNYTLAYPLLKKYNVPATFFISSAYVGVKTANDHFTWADALEMEKSGLIDIQIHGYDHTPFTELSKADLEYQISISRGLIEQYLGMRDVVVVSYPQFRHTRSTQALLTQMGINFQITDLATKGTFLQKFASVVATAIGTAGAMETTSGTVLQRDSIQRINVPNTMSAEELITTLEHLTD